MNYPKLTNINLCFFFLCQVTHKFKTLVRVVAAYPCRASDLRSLLAGSYCLRLTLEDPTARIRAYVHKDDGVICNCITIVLYGIVYSFSSLVSML
jgi:hypothetical protein